MPDTFTETGLLPDKLAGLALPMPCQLPKVLQPRDMAAEQDKRLPSLAAVFDAFSIADGQVLSFHHHYRNGEQVIAAVFLEAKARGIKGLTLAASSLFPCHASLIPLIQDGTIAHIVTDYMRGPLADAVQAGQLSGVTVLQSHGGRARAISSGALQVDVAFVAAPLAHVSGATTGRGGALACGPLGYPAVDVAYARATVVLVDQLTTEPLPLVDLPAHYVDAVLHFPAPGTPEGIASGSTLPLQTPDTEVIGTLVAEIVAAAGLMVSGISLQSGAGGYSLGAVPIIGRTLSDRGLRGGFLSGGITGAHAALLAEGVFSQILDVQCFDREAVKSSIVNPNHRMMSAAEYASPLHPNAVVDRLDVMLLGAVEVDHAYNVNVTAGANGRILGGPGGHPDTAQGAKLSIVTTTLTGGGWPKIVPQVRSISTEGVDVDVVVTNRGYAVNPQRTDLARALRGLSAPVFAIEDLAGLAAELAPQPEATSVERSRIFVEHRLGHRLGRV
jgi:citrate lyase subunit alpha/citrate CoA-transferase